MVNNIASNSSGWSCPKCGNVYGPSVTECHRCNTPAVPQALGPYPLVCTCGSSASTGICPMHGGVLSQTLFPTVWYKSADKESPLTYSPPILHHDFECDCSNCNYYRTVKS